MYRRDTQQKAKILRRVGFPLQMLDVFEFCSSNLKTTLEERRTAWQQQEDAKAELAKKRQKGESGEAKPGESESMAADAGHTGFYDLHAIITHKGRIADSGHYVGWVKRDGQWVEFDATRDHEATLMKHYQGVGYFIVSAKKQNQKLNFQE